LGTFIELAIAGPEDISGYRTQVQF